METTERIVESYCRYIKGWFTISNIRCSGQYEIDLLAVDASSDAGVKRYHIESGVSISGAYSKLTANEFSLEMLRDRDKQAKQRRTIGYFERKFNSKGVISELEKYGFKEGNYKKVIVTWGWTTEAEEAATNKGIILWDFRDILKKIAETCSGRKTYFANDTLRTIQLFLRSYVFETTSSVIQLGKREQEHGVTTILFECEQAAAAFTRNTDSAETIRRMRDERHQQIC